MHELALASTAGSSIGNGMGEKGEAGTEGEVLLIKAAAACGPRSATGQNCWSGHTSLSHGGQIS